MQQSLNPQMDAEHDRHALTALLDAQHKAERLFQESVDRGLIVPGLSESAVSTNIYDLGHELFGTRRHWHRRLVRSGVNTLSPYAVRTPDRVLQEDDILFLDFGPVFRGWEADLGRTYVLGNDPDKQRLARDVDAGWRAGHELVHSNAQMTAAELFEFTSDWARERGWEFGGAHCGHHVGRFPHERVIGEDRKLSLLCPENSRRIHTTNRDGHQTHWIYEVHFVDRDKCIGGFHEQLLTDRLPVPLSS